MDRNRILIELAQKLPQLSENHLFYLDLFIDDCLLDQSGSASESSKGSHSSSPNIEIEDSPLKHSQ